jgi:hypothetical protein
MTLLIPKRQIIRNPDYRRHVACLPCMVCGVEGYSQCAHISHGNHARGMKASDDLCIPLCATRPGMMGCHAMFDQYTASFVETVMQTTIDALKAHAQRMYREWEA